VTLFVPRDTMRRLHPLYHRIYRFGDRRLIGDRCPCDLSECPDSVKLRYMAVVILPMIPLAAVSNPFLPDGSGWNLAWALVLAVTWATILSPAFDAVNDRMPEYCEHTGVRTDV
jgi:hypothetical protein